ncbi:MAG: hypothetical protein PUB11_05155 [Oscillospiraceae bacterium]|nr:hypothetical protein [Oscillospiraceae bacterium]
MKSTKRIISAVLAVFAAVSMTACSQKAKNIDTSTELGKNVEATASYVYKKLGNNPKQGTEMSVISLLESGYMDYWDDRAQNYVINMNTFIQKGGNKIADKKNILWDQYPIVFETFTACGIYADKTANADLTQGITVDAITLMGGFDNKINCLTALECGGLGVYQSYNNENLTREDLVEFILGLQQPDGSFSYSGMTDGLTVAKVTSDAVIALMSTAQTEEITRAANKGADYLKNTVKPTDDLYDVCATVIALNYAGRDARDYVDGLAIRAYSDGSYSKNTADKKGNIEDSSYVLLALSSQYRFEKGMAKVYDYSESYGMAHNKLSPMWKTYVNIMKVALGFIILGLIGLFILSRVRIAKWRKAGIYNERASRMYTDAELERIRKEKELHAQKLERENNRSVDETDAKEINETSTDVNEISGSGDDSGDE